jgi:hypothetical protein
MPSNGYIAQWSTAASCVQCLLVHYPIAISGFEPKFFDLSSVYACCNLDALDEDVDDGIIQSNPAPGEIRKRGRQQNSVQDVRTAYFFINAVRVES